MSISMSLLLEANAITPCRWSWAYGEENDNLLRISFIRKT